MSTMEKKNGRRLPAGLIGTSLAVVLVAGVCWAGQAQDVEVSVAVKPAQNNDGSGMLERAEKAGLEMEQRMQKCMAGWGYRYDVHVPTHIYDSIASSSWASKEDQQKASVKLQEVKALAARKSQAYAGTRGYQHASEVCRGVENRRNDDIRENMAKSELVGLKKILASEGQTDVLDQAAQIMSSRRNPQDVQVMPAEQQVGAIVEAYTISRPEYKEVLARFAQCAKKNGFEAKNPNELGRKYSDRLSPFVPRNLNDDEWGAHAKRYKSTLEECQPIIGAFHDKIQKDLYDRL